MLCLDVVTAPVTPLRSGVRSYVKPAPEVTVQPTGTLARRRQQQTLICGATRQPLRRDSPPDPQEAELAAADLVAKQSLYTQLLDRKRSSQPSEASTSGRHETSFTSDQSTPAEPASTELIFRLERRGEGWGEEIFPHLVVEQRPRTDVQKRDRNRSSRPKPWTV